MRDFLKYTLAGITAFVLVGIIVVVFCFVSLVSLTALDSTHVTVKENSVFVLKLDGILKERSSGNSFFETFSLLYGDDENNLFLDEIIEAIEKAQLNENIKGIYIEAGLFVSDSPASTQAIRNALAQFKDSGKWIVSYGDTYTQSAYYICSLADKILVNPQGIIDWHGLSAQPIFFKDMLSKIGIKMQVLKEGKYKSATETFTADRMSDPDREQVEVYVKGIWKNMIENVAESRGLTTENLDSLADVYMSLADPMDYIASHLADSLAYTDEITQVIHNMLGSKDRQSDINKLSIDEMKRVKTVEKDDEDKVAIYYAYGDIVDKKTSVLASDEAIEAQKMCRDLDKLAKDSNIKAVVLRINSPGGSAYASEQIWHSVEKLKEKKPVVVSMGGYAASGGYYISCPADYIFAEPTTITGSIGIFAMYPDVSSLLKDKLGIKSDEVKTNKYSSFGTPFRPMNNGETEILKGYVERGYSLFKRRVSQGRGLTIEQVETVAQGRVWLGEDALKINLVDQLGDITDAIEKAATLAGIENWSKVEFPKRKTLLEQILDNSDQDSYIESKIRSMAGQYYLPITFFEENSITDAVQARMDYNLVLR